MLTVDAIEEEIYRRELARRHLRDFAEYTYAGYVLGPAHELICAELDAAVRRVQEGLDQRLVVTCPPGLGKSLLISRLFPAKLLGRFPRLACAAGVLRRGTGARTQPRGPRYCALG